MPQNSVLRRWRKGWNGILLPTIADVAPVDLRIVGRTLFHAALVGLACGIAGALFFGALEYLQRFLLEDLAGYVPLRAHGETFAASGGPHTFRPWLLVLLPALGGLACGLLTRLAPEVGGGGGDAMIEAFHRHDGVIRRRLIWLKPLASLVTLGTGGAGGREGPTMQIGGALGSLVGRGLKVSPRERRILLVAGVAAGISAVFRTPLGAALLAAEVLYRDGFESDALVPSVLASVVAYSFVISVYGQSTLFAHAQHFPFVLGHLPLYGLMALLCAVLAAAFAACLRRIPLAFAKVGCPVWLRPAIGGLLLGALCTVLIVEVGKHTGRTGYGFGLLGGGYGAVQMAISGLPWPLDEWTTVELFLLLAGAKLVAASLTIGSGGSAGDFAPSLAIGGLFGGAFGRAALLILEDPRIDPGAFALVGMGAFYGGIAHVPLAALVLVCELAGNYDLLVPLMLSQGIAFIALRKRSLYPSQLPTQQDSPVYRDAFLRDALGAIRVGELMTKRHGLVSFRLTTRAEEMLSIFHQETDQETFPVVDDGGKLVGVVNASTTRLLATEVDHAAWTLAADVMLPPVALHQDDNLRFASKQFLTHGLRELPVVNDAEQVIGFLDEHEIAAVYLRAEARADAASSISVGPVAGK